MKTLATPLFFLNKPISFGQEVLNKLSPTTEAEYNYLTKGYRVQMESGLDMTKGYTFQDMDHVKYGNYSCQVKVSFVRKNKELAGLLVVTKSDVFGRIDYVGIPLIRIYSHAISNNITHETKL